MYAYMIVCIGKISWVAYFVHFLKTVLYKLYENEVILLCE